MTVEELILRLQGLPKQSAIINLMIDLPNVQLEYPLQDIALSKYNTTVTLIYEAACDADSNKNDGRII